MVCVTVMELSCGLMVLAMREIGATTKPTERANLCMPMVMFMKENGSMIKPKAKELTATLMAHTTRVLGSTTSNTVTVWRAGLMVPGMRDSTLRVRKREKEN